MNRFGAPPVVAPFIWQPTRTGLKGLGSFASSTVSSAAAGASAGAAAASVIPIVGTAVGAILGAVGGVVSAALHRVDPETADFNQAVAMWQSNPASVYNIANKYLPLAGLFDLSLKGPHIPIYQKYGRMGEFRFVSDLVNEVYQAAQQGQIGPNDTALTIMSRIVQPWIDSWGYGPMQDPHGDLINRLIVGMINDYIGGIQGNWTAVGGDYPFSSLPRFSLPSAVPVPAPASSPVTTVNPVGTPVSAAPIPPPVTVAPIPPPISTVIPVVAPTPVPPSSTIPAIGSAVTIVPDMGKGGLSTQVPAGLVFAGLDPTNSSWILTNAQTGQQYVLWQGNVVPYQASMFVPAAVAPVGTTTTIPQVASTSATIGTTAAGVPVTQADLQALITQLAAQGQTAQQAYTSALQTLQANGVAATAGVQSAVQSAVQSTPAPTAAPTTAGLSGLGWIGVIAAGATLLLATARPVGKSRSGKRR